MRVGQLRHNVTIQERDASAGNDTAGQPTLVYRTFVNLHASIEPLTGRELVAAQAAQNGVTHRVRVRYYQGITAAMRVKYGTRFFNILAILNKDERNRELVLLCEEGLTENG